MNIPLRGKNWSEQEHAEIGRLEAVCSATDHWSLECDHTDAAIRGALYTTSSTTSTNRDVRDRFRSSFTTTPAPRFQLGNVRSNCRRPAGLSTGTPKHMPSPRQWKVFF